jgi:hypothetical protein
MRELDVETLKAFEGFVAKHIPGFEVRYKDESYLMAILGVLAAPFNRDFATRYTTTWGKRVYFPSREFYRVDPSRSFRILAHEFVHLWDSQEHWYFKLSYMMPQLLVLVPILVLMFLLGTCSWILGVPIIGYVLGAALRSVHFALFWFVFGVSVIGTGIMLVFFGGWLPLVVGLVALLCLCPWPSPWRTKWELRGYGMNVALARWLYDTTSAKHFFSIARHFTGPNYFYMCRSLTKILAALGDYTPRDGVPRDEPYQRVRAFLRGS